MQKQTHTALTLGELFEFLSVNETDRILPPDKILPPDRILPPACVDLYQHFMSCVIIVINPFADTCECVFE